TTGSPKGVEFTVTSLLGRTASAERTWMPRHPFMCLLGLDTVSGFQTFAWSVLTGHTYIVPSDGPTNLRLIERHQIRSIKASPARLENLVDAHTGADPAAVLALAEIQVAGSLLSPSLAMRCETQLGRIPTYLYGSTEVGTVTRGVFDPTRPNAVGTVVADAELELVDDDGAAVTGEGVRGRIRYRSAHIPDSYWRGTSEANASFRDGWFYPGDLGSWGPGGELLISGRTDDLVNAGGAKFNLAELDLWMSELDVFTDCASFQFRDAAGAVSIGLAFQSRNPVNPEVILERVRGLLPNLEIRALMRIDAIPRNQLGKVTRTALSAQMGDQGQ
ncbi:MAG: AMP-binding protein, partial [Rhodoglobus sp.]